MVVGDTIAIMTLQCNKCKVHLPLGEFTVRRCGRIQVCCNLCNQKAKEYQRKRKMNA